MKACNYFTNFILLNYIFPCLLKLFCMYFCIVLWSAVVLWQTYFSLDHFFLLNITELFLSHMLIPLHNSSVPETLPPLQKGSALALTIELLWYRQIPNRFLYKWKQVVYSTFLLDTFQMWSLARISKAVHTTVWKTSAAWKLLLEASVILQETGCLWGQVNQHL